MTAVVKNDYTGILDVMWCRHENKKVSSNTLNLDVVTKS